jgi:large subunit ribosomal protein L25
MKSVALKAYPRTLTGRGGAKRVHATGRIPAVIYGRGVQAQNLELIRKDLEDLIHHSVSETRLVDLFIEGDTRANRLVLLQELQHHPLRGDVLHVDLREVSETEKVTIMVPVETTGEPIGVKSGGGVLEHVLFRLRVRGLPRDLPEYIQVDVTNLDVGQAIHIGDIQRPPNAEILGDKSLSVIAVAVHREPVEEVPAEAAPAAGEVEMIREKKETEPEAEGGKPKAEGAKPGAEAAKPKAEEKEKEREKERKR